jgi:pimeloyl-ACP methyl ester carboxylesterase
MFTQKSACRRALLIAPVLSLLALFSLGAGGPAGAKSQADHRPRPTIVLVHGDWADASSWTSVIERLQDRGFAVVAPPNLLRGPAADAPYLASYLQTISGPIVLVAHSYGGFVTTNAATGNPNVKALVYIDSFMPDEGEIGGALIAGSGSCVDESAFNAVHFDGGVDLYLRWEANPPYPGFIDCFANGVGLEDARVLAAAQRPAALAQFSESSGPPAWKTIPSWSLIGTLDNVIPPALQERMSSRAGAHVSRVRAGHLTPITRPAAVTKVIPLRDRRDEVIRLIEVATTGRDPVVAAETGERGGVPAARRDVPTRARGGLLRRIRALSATGQVAGAATDSLPLAQSGSRLGFAARCRELRAWVSQAIGGGLLSALFERAGSQSQTRQAWRKAERAKSSAAARGSGAVRTSAQSSRYSPS